jgi:hypothetical protein
MSKKKLPVGVSDFKDVIAKNYYFVDKSLFIRDVVDGALVLLYPRPRRFGKTLNLSMLKYFYEMREKNRKLFKDLAISKEKDIMKRQGKNPVVFITLKDVIDKDLQNCLRKIYDLIREVYSENREVLNSDEMSKLDKDYFKKILSDKANITDYANSLKNLSRFIYQYHKVKPVILIDEYDTPIQAAFINKFYDDFITFMRGLLSGVLKDNIYLEKAVLTGILRVSKESIFSGLNNIFVASILAEEAADKFGFLETEVKQMLEYYEISNSFNDVKNMYDGYNFAGSEVYNPWSIMNYLNTKMLIPHWVNTSGNDLIKELCQNADESVKRELEILIEKGSIQKPIDDNIVFADLENDDVLWSFMLMCGYLRYDNLTFNKTIYKTIVDLSIPNEEIMSIFVRDIITNWFKRPESTDELNHLANELVYGDIENFKKSFIEFCESSFSYHDVGREEPEKFYHGFVLGLLVCLRDKYRITSNREAGYGRYDLMLEPNDKSQRGIIFEFKTVDATQRQTFESVIERAKKQIIEKKYAQELISRGVKDIVHIIAVFEGKEVRVETFKQGE